MRILIAAAIFLGAAACDSPPATQPEDFDTVNATVTDEAAPPGALDNESVNYGEGSITPAERNSRNQSDSQVQSPEQVVGQYANLLVRRRFEDAHAMWDPEAADFTPGQLAQKFERFRTVQAEIGGASAPEGAAGSVYDEVQLTLSGTRTDGSNYTVTGPVTVRRVNDVPGSTAEQRQWRIVKMVLTGNPRAADALVEPEGRQ